jgi:hypothetical protein
MEIHNHTRWTAEQIAAMPVVATSVNNWRRRNITLHQHPEQPDSVLSVGITFDGKMKVIAEEGKVLWMRALDCASRGEVEITS